MAIVTGDVPADTLIAAVPSAGAKFKATLAEPQALVLRVADMRCMKNCGSKVQKALLAVDGVIGAFACYVCMEMCPGSPCGTCGLCRRRC